MPAEPISAPDDAVPAGNGHLELEGSSSLLSYGVISDAGPTRDSNEDFAGAYTPGDPSQPWERGPLFAVADGMGGHAAGEVASRVAIETLFEHWTSTPFTQPAGSLRDATRAANLAVIEASAGPGRTGMGTTLTALTLNGFEAFVAHVGDSRAYLVRGETCTQLTNDHSRVGEMLRMRLITVEQALVHPARSQLTKSLGADPLLQIQLVRQPVLPGDVLFLCCDGLWDKLSSPEMAILVAAGSIGAAGAAARRLVDTAVARGATDNVTAVVVRVHSDRPIPPAPSRRSFFRRTRS